MIKPLEACIHNFIQSYEKNDWKITLLKNWSSIVGNLEHHVVIERLEDHAITLGVFDSCWLQELYLLSPMILEKINKSIDPHRINHIRLKLIARSKRKKIVHAKKISAQTATNTVYALTSQEHLMLNNIKDPHLREALKKFYMQCRKE